MLLQPLDLCGYNATADAQTALGTSSAAQYGLPLRRLRIIADGFLADSVSEQHQRQTQCRLQRRRRSAGRPVTNAGTSACTSIRHAPGGDALLRPRHRSAGSPADLRGAGRPWGGTTRCQRRRRQLEPELPHSSQLPRSTTIIKARSRATWTASPFSRRQTVPPATHPTANTSKSEPALEDASSLLLANTPLRSRPGRNDASARRKLL